LLLAEFLSKKRKLTDFIKTRLCLVLGCFLSAVCASAFHLVFLAKCF